MRTRRKKKRRKEEAPIREREKEKGFEAEEK